MLTDCGVPDYTQWLTEYRAQIMFYPKHPDRDGYTDVFQCNGCRKFVFMTHPDKRCEYRFCPYCGGSAEHIKKPITIL